MNKVLVNLLFMLLILSVRSQAQAAESQSSFDLQSPDGRHLAIQDASYNGNMWLMENF